MSEYLELLRKVKEKQKPEEVPEKEELKVEEPIIVEVKKKVKPKKVKSKKKPKETKKMFLVGKGKKKLVSALERFDFEDITIDTLRGVKFIIIGKTDKKSDKLEISKEIKDLLSKPEYLGQLLEHISIFLKSVP